MLPSILSRQIRQGIGDFLETTFPVTTAHFAQVMTDFVARDEELFRGPFLSIRLPFEQGDGGEAFPDVSMGLRPYRHQQRAFERLGGWHPRSTLVATGTGSGKTESFLYPILNYCLQMRRQGVPGIKAVLIYPMNALATDQARRIARIIAGNEALREHVSAGLYVGQKNDPPVPQMTAQSPITDRQVLRNDPPDILLTNYKMLDYLLLRPRDAKLWQHNGPETLRFLVVDELHTFDGAQGTDLACLLRRLKARLGTPAQHLCCIGTSATLGAGQQTDALRSYAGRVFGEDFDEDAVITEATVDALRFLGMDRAAAPPPLPPQGELTLRADERPADYLRRQSALWTESPMSDWRVEGDDWTRTLAARLPSVPFFQWLLPALGAAPRDVDALHAAYVDALRSEGSEDVPADSRVRLPDADDLSPLQDSGMPDRMHFSLAVESLAACVSAARGDDGRPYLHVRHQLWFRELRRLVCTVGEHPRLRLSDELTSDDLERALPLLHCRECGATAWGAVLPEVERKARKGLQEFYSRYFAKSLDVAFLFPEEHAMDLRHEQWHLCPDCLTVDKQATAEECRACGSDRASIPVMIWRKPRTLKNRTIGVHDCPYCEGADSMTIVGSRAASLISVVNAQLFASPFNADKKLLAFSDSVQDASHRAGFFTARTYRFNVRTALQHFVQSLERDLTLEEFPRAFIRWWRQNASMDDFLGTFLPPDMEWMEDWDSYRSEGRLPDGSALLELVERRIRWEIYAEYGFAARIGRTLEKSGSSVAGPDLVRIDRVLAELHDHLREQFGVLRNIPRDAVTRFVLGMLTQLKNRGALFQSDLAHYITQGGNTWMLNKAVHLPNFGPHSRAPAFLIDGAADRFDLLVARTGRRSWYEDWAVKCLAETDELFESLLPDILRGTVAVLEKHELLLPFEAKGGNAYALQPGAFRVGADVAQLRCERCGHAQSVPAPQSGLWLGGACMRYSCPGRYGHDERGGGYYASLYADGDVKRLVSREHTGLLDSGARKDIEERFMQGTKPWDPNLLSCTPTLEMGVDIGDLSTVVLCSVPPSQSSYVQRIGRAGRRDGNALNITVAAATPHDQYFFAEPTSMISGHIQPPGCFLNAPAVLERQFTAYCFDRWVLAGAREEDLPAKLGAVLTALKNEKPASFPWVFFSFVSEQRDALYDSFCAMFAGHLDDGTIAYLRRFAFGDDDQGDMAYRIEKALRDQLNEIRDMDLRIKGLDRQIKDTEVDPAAGETKEEVLRELQAEKQGLLAILADLRGKHILAFLTDEGFLPNYAFPEAGIMLRSVIYRRAMQGSVEGQKVTSWHYEYERPAAAAIKELAPSSSFYAEGRRVVVDQVNLRLSEPEDWRFCPVCSHAEREESGAGDAGCPHCGAAGWRDARQKRRLLRLRQVLATTSDRESRSWDEHDDRSPTFYVRDTLVQPDTSSIASAFAIDNEEVPFGFEFVGSARFVDINFGEENGEGENVRIAGRELPRPGFVICRACGRVQNERNRRKHTRSCKLRESEDEKHFADMLYLYREFSTEAIRMLLPATSLLPSRELEHSFIAALLLGLREKFRGNIDHLQTTLMQEPVPHSGVMKNYLVLYDIVPGGTGYLKELLQSTDVLREVFQLALDHLRGCSCGKDGEKDGCYSCLYAYRLSYHMADISRRSAIALLESILEAWDTLHAVKSIDEISVFPLLESELERYFLATLSGARVDDRPVSRTRRFIDGMDGYRMRIGEREYGLVFQKSLGHAEDVAVPSRTDFVLYPLDEDPAIKPVVVFTDGFQYHALKANGPGRVGHDLNQRMALLRSGRYHVWSITWRDLDRHHAEQQAPPNPFLATRQEMLDQLLRHSSITDAQRRLSGCEHSNAFAQLLEFLAHGSAADMRQYALYHAMAGIASMSLADESAAQQRREQVWLSPDTDALAMPVSLPSGTWMYDEKEITLLGHRAALLSRALPMTAAADPAAYDQLRLLLRFGDAPDYSDDGDYEQCWNHLLEALNFWQFIPHFAVVADSGVGEALPAWITGGAVESSADIPDAAWELPPEDILTPEEAAAARGIEAMGPGAGALMAELHAGGRVVAQALAAWPAAQVALVATEEAAAAYATAGWICVTAENWKDRETDIRKQTGA